MLNWCLLEFITTLGYIHYSSGTIRLLRTVLIAAEHVATTEHTHTEAFTSVMPVAMLDAAA